MAASGDMGQTPQLCRNGCGFFGSAQNRGLCSKCFREVLIKDQLRALTVKEPEDKPKLDEKDNATTGPLAATTAPTSEKPAASRCQKCNKKIGLLNVFKCRCGGAHCTEHRYPELHHCTFDFKKHGRDFLSKANPVTKADKLEDRI